MNDLIALQVKLDRMAFHRRAEPEDVATLIEARTAIYELSILKRKIADVMKGV